MTFLGLVYPILAGAMLACIIIWLFINPKPGIFVFILLFAAGYKNNKAIFAARTSGAFNLQKDPSTLRVLHWNVKNFSDNSHKAESPTAERRGMLNYIREVNPDVILLQEYLDVTGDKFYSNNKVLSDTLGYKYAYTSNDKVDIRGGVTTAYGCAIFSKYPLSNVRHFPFGDPCFSKSLTYANVNFKGRMFRLATTHLCSFNLGSPKDNAEFFGRVDGDFILHSSQFEKLMHFDSIHAKQAIFARKLLDTSHLPIILTGDLNSVPGSYAYHIIKGKLQDAFVKKGSGFGRTFTGLFATLRIDYIFADQQFQVKQYTSPKLYLSDHFPVVADIKWK